MPYLTIDDLTTHLYPEVILEITRETVKEFATLAGFPVAGIKRYNYKATNTGKYYIWDGDSYIETVYPDRLTKAINTGIGEAISYLTRYDTVKMFSSDDNKRTFQDDNLDSKVKDLIIWHLVKLCNVQANLEVMETNYNKAISYFKDVQKGIADPAWPLKSNSTDTPGDDAGQVEFRCETKRRNSY